MREPNKNCIYSLGDLTSEEKNQLLEKLIELDNTWDDDVAKEDLFSNKYLHFTNSYNSLGEWLVSDVYFTTNEIVNAKELFYTLENIQVDCRELSEDKIKDMINIFVSKSVRCGGNMDLNKDKIQVYLYINYNNITVMDRKHNNKTIITYEKFMEVFSRKEENFKKLVEVLNEELTEESFKEITNSIADLLIYKNEKYGNSALNPLNIFNGKSKVGQRIDDKLARVKNSKELRKNDIADLLGYLTLVCQENNWTNFDEFKD